MKQKVMGKLFVNGAASFLSVLLLLSMVAAPVLATVTANSVNSSSIVDRSIRTRDIKRDAINTSRIKNHSIRKEDIRSASINKYKLTTGAVNTYKILDETIKNADISPSASIADSKIKYSTKTKNLSIPAAAFTPITNTMNYANVGYIVLPVPPSSGGGWVAPVSLPDGAKITKFRLDGADTSAGADMGGTLIRLNYPTNTPAVMANATSSGTSVSWQHPVDSTIANPVIDNINNNYSVTVGAGTGGLALGGVLITYQVNGP